MPLSEMGLPAMRAGFDLDALDLKNLPDYDPDNSEEAGFYSAEALYAWIKADQEACVKGARPTSCELFDAPRQPRHRMSSADQSESTSRNLRVRRLLLSRQGFHSFTLAYYYPSNTDAGSCSLDLPDPGMQIR